MFSWSKEMILALPRAEWPPVPIQVEGFPLLVWGRIHPDGRNAWVVCGEFEADYSWGAVLQALNDRTGLIRLLLERPKPRRWSTLGDSQ